LVELSILSCESFGDILGSFIDCGLKLSLGESIADSRGIISGIFGAAFSIGGG